MKYSKFVTPIIEIAMEAGRIIMEYYGKDSGVTIKSDKSPVTKADVAANEHIVKKLKSLAQEIPVIAEESVNKSSAETGNVFWLVDPLDGTKSFIKGTGEFTVNIALVDNGVPVLGVVFVPVTDEIFYTGQDGHAYSRQGSEPAEIISVRKTPKSGLVVVASGAHRTKETDDYISHLPDITGFSVASIVPASSSLKFCLLAGGEADVYPRFGPTMEWDTAAGNAVLLAAGGRVENIDGSIFTYGKHAFKNGNFIAWGTRPDVIRH